MANLKSDLDEYLLQNESRRSYKISLPFSTPSFFSRNNDETPTSTSSTGTWFENVQKEYFTLVSKTSLLLLNKYQAVTTITLSLMFNVSESDATFPWFRYMFILGNSLLYIVILLYTSTIIESKKVCTIVHIG